MAPAKPEPEPTALTRRYWEGAARHELRVPWCETCADWVFPPRPRCHRCGGTGLSERSPASTGKVVTFTVVHQAAYEAYRADQPYVIAVVALDGGPQLMTNLVDVTDPESVGVGARVELTFERRGDVAVPQFRPSRRPE